MTDMNAAMKADYLRVLSENKKLKQENANLQKELHTMKSIIPKEDPIEVEVNKDE
tara:strand:+ start:252 stop:416 length:165 start_codon:yes stop_codon:yes gene_type:complete